MTREPVLSRSRAVLIPVAVGLLVRLLVVGVSFGTNDVHHWDQFCQTIRAQGLMQTYVTDAFFNHPPLVSYLLSGLHYMASVTQTEFSYWLKIPAVTGDVFAIWLAASLLQERRWLVWFAVLSPVNVLISAYHGNTDALCAAACLFSVCYMQRGEPRAAAVALGIALNVKLLPAALVICLLGCCSSWATFRRFVGCLLPFALPFAVALVQERDAFAKHVLGYNSLLGPWGLPYFAFHDGARYPWLNQFLVRVFVPNAKYLILGFATLIAGIQFWRGRFTGPELAALAFCASLVLAPGFGVQYMIYPILPLIIARPRLGAELAVACGLFVFITYAYYWTGGFPMVESKFRSPAPGPAEQAVGLIVWYLLARATWVVFSLAMARRANATGYSSNSSTSESTR